MHSFIGSRFEVSKNLSRHSIQSKCR